MLRSSPSHATYNLQHALEVLTEVSTLIPYKAFAQTQSQCKFTSEIKQAPQIGCSKSNENFLSKLLRSAVVIYIYIHTAKTLSSWAQKIPGGIFLNGGPFFGWLFFGVFQPGFVAFMASVAFVRVCGFCFTLLYLSIYLIYLIYLI